MRRGPLLAALGAVLALAALALAAGAAAKQLQPYEFQSSFNGADATGGAFTGGLRKIEIDQSTGNLYVLDEGSGKPAVSLFDAAGHAKLFTGLSGVSTLVPPSCFVPTEIAFDNSGHGGGLYMDGCFENKNLRAYNADGSIRLSSFGTSGNHGGLGVDQTSGFLFVGNSQTAEKYNPDSGFSANEELLFEQQVANIEVDSHGFFYLNKYNNGEPGLYKYGTEAQTRKKEDETTGFGDHSFAKFSYVPTEDLAIDPSDDHLFALENESQVTEYSPEGAPLQTFGLLEGGFAGLGGSAGIAVSGATHDVYVTDRSGAARVAVFDQGAAVTVPDATTDPAGHPDAGSAVLKGTINPDGTATTGCKFEWGSTSQYLNGEVPCDEGEVLEGSADQPVSAPVESLTLGNSYHYRVVAKNANGRWSYGADHSFEASTAPTTASLLVDRVNTDGARFSAGLVPHGGTTHYHFEVGLGDCASNPCTQVPEEDATLGSNLDPAQVFQTTSGLLPNTTYHVRLVAENGAGALVVDRLFHTYPSPPVADACGNAQVRKQGGAYLLPDCRAYELVSAANAGGYDVESDLVPGQQPFAAHPGAQDRALYGLHFGSIPGAGGSPTNYSLDPYVAERGPQGWVSRYVGLPSDGMADLDAFGSPLLAADEGLESFAFGGPGICQPCFAGRGTNLPVRLRGGAPQPGMAGSAEPGEAAPEGLVADYLSADGSHLVFGSSRRFEPTGAEGALTIYERDLGAGGTEVVSTDQSGAPFSGAGVAALGLSADGSRVIVAKPLSEDGDGNDRYHLYMHLAGAAASADLTPGATAGAYFDGISADGARAFLTTADQLLPADTDESADIYEAAVGATGAVALRLVSVSAAGAPSNDDGCDPPGIPDSWNAAGGPGRCDALAFAGGAGVAAGDGSFYFLSPELLEPGKGEAGQANLYVVAPGGDPRFVATIDSSVGKAPAPGPEHPLDDGEFGAVPTAEAITVDQSNGDVYAVAAQEGKVTRLDSNGAPANFTQGPGAGTDTIAAFGFKTPSAAQVAVDNAAGSPFQGDFYVAATSGENAGVSVWAANGEKLGLLSGSATSVGHFGEACGVAVDPTDGSLYVGDSSGYLWRYRPTGSAPVSDADYAVTGIQTIGMSPCATAADGAGHVYASNYSEGPAKRFLVAGFKAGTPPGQSGSLLDSNSKALAADPVTHQVYVDEASQIGVFDATGARLATISGAGTFSGSRGVAVNSTSGHVYVSAVTAGTISEFGFVQPPYRPIDNPAIVDATRQPTTHSFGDFQVTADGRFAVFASGQSLTGYENLGRSEVYRFDSQSDIAGQEIACASCAPTLAAAKADTFLSPDGLNVSDDGRVFFTSDEGLVLSDTNERRDAYEWSGGRVDLLSTGRSLDDSSLLSVSSDGVDAFFFTRDVLVPEDENGGAVKIYDARQGGGFLRPLQGPPCAASDECHGPGTPSPGPPDINSVAGSGEGGYELPPAARCKRGFVKKHGACLRKKKPRKHHGRHGSKKGAGR